MSALTDLFTAMANKIRSKVGGSDTYTPPEMVDAMDDVYNAGIAAATTPITPSDSNPAALTANTPVNPTANGYAIESQPQSVTPSTSGAAFNSGIAKMSSGGYAYSQKPQSVKTGTFQTSSASQSITVDTGLGNALKGFVCFGVSQTTYNTQEFVRWDDSLGNYFYAGGCYSTAGVSLKNQAFTSTSQNYCPVISGISNGIVSMVGASGNVNWRNYDFVWWAW